MKKLFFALGLTFLLCFFSVNAQNNPVKWSFSSEKISNDEYNLLMKATIEKNWHVYSMDADPVFTTPTSFKFGKSADFSLIGKISQPKPIEEQDEDLGATLKYFTKEVTFKQKIKITSTNKTIATGSVTYMVCDDHQCLPPETVKFSIDVKGNEATASTVENDDERVDSSVVTTTKDSTTLNSSNTQSIDNQINKPKKQSLWKVFIYGILGGLIALVTPCVWPMIPMTVSFFLKSAGDKKKGIKNALYYGLSIIIIYDVLGLGITLIFGDDALNTIATNPWLNVFLFLILVVFAISFFGAFELTLPSSWINKMDANADKRRGFWGIFFMALTLVLVSFSCTAPIVGTLLVEIVTGGLWGPLIGMTGFALALAIPFTLFAIFPSWLSNMPKSGGWMNSVKVVLAFLELALSMKFLSTADEMMSWHILDRETFIALWIIIFGLLSLYLLGKIKFKNDSDTPYVSVFRLFLAIITLAFTVYMVPGLWGAPLKAIAAFTPKMYTQDFKLSYDNTNVKDNSTIQLPTGNTSTSTSSSGNLCNDNPKYSDMLHLPEGYHGYFDYDEGLACARQLHKPVFIDFTGHNCVNCRKMENAVWIDPTVKQILNDEYVIIELYVDDLNPLKPEDYITINDENGNKTTITKIGKKWKYYQKTKFANNSQPYYVLIDNNEKLLTTPYAFDKDPQHFQEFLKKGIEEFKKR